MTYQPFAPAASIAGPLTGVTVALLRTPDRARATIEELMLRGARVVLAPLIDWELPESTRELDMRLEAASGYDWIILTSGTTVSALAARARSLGSGLAELLGKTRVAAVGSATARALASLDVEVHCIPDENQSAAGLLSVLPVSSPARALLPQSNLAADTLSVGLTHRGWSVDTVVAYLTVDYPAREDRRVPISSEEAHMLEPLAPLLTREALTAAIGMGAVDAVVVSSPSIAERLRTVMKDALGLTERPLDTSSTVPEPAVVAIGGRTERDALALGLWVDAVAASPSPPGIADAVEAAVVVRRTQPGNQPQPRKAGNPL